MYYVYAISSISQNYIYVGLTHDPQQRIHQHNCGYERTTKPYMPFKVLLIEEFESRVKAREREKELKTTQGKRYLRSLQ